MSHQRINDENIAINIINEDRKFYQTSTFRSTNNRNEGDHTDVNSNAPPSHLTRLSSQLTAKGRTGWVVEMRGERGECTEWLDEMFANKKIGVCEECLLRG